MTHFLLSYRSKLERDRDRDVTEKIALGVPSGGVSQDSLFDQRLFNQSKVTSSLPFLLLPFYVVSWKSCSMFLTWRFYSHVTTPHSNCVCHTHLKVLFSCTCMCARELLHVPRICTRVWLLPSLIGELPYNVRPCNKLVRTQMMSGRNRPLTTQYRVRPL